MMMASSASLSLPGIWDLGRIHHHHQLYSGSQESYNELNLGSGSWLYYLRMASASTVAPGDRNSTEHREGGGNVSMMIIDSFPLVLGKSSSSSGRITDTTANRLRLFGVNMECSSSSNTVGHVPMADSYLSSPNLQYL